MVCLIRLVVYVYTTPIICKGSHSVNKVRIFLKSVNMVLELRS